MIKAGTVSVGSGNLPLEGEETWVAKSLEPDIPGTQKPSLGRQVAVGWNCASLDPEIPPVTWETQTLAIWRQEHGRALAP